MDLSNLKGILAAIRSKEIECGIDKDYCFVVDEDGRLVFLKRNREVHADYDGEPMTQWPVNPSDGEELWARETYENRGLRIAEEFLEAIGVEFQG